MQPTQVVKNANVMTLLIQEMANTNLIDLTSTDATRDKCKNNNQCRGGGGEFYTAGGRGAYARGGGRGGW